MADTSDDIYNLYKACEECGSCCELTVLAMGIDEAQRIKSYVSDNGIAADDQGPGICPFRNREDMRCRIYPVRPKTCRLHSCKATRQELQSLNPDLDIPDAPLLVDMRMAFIQGEIIDPRTMSEEWIIEHFTED